MSTSISEYEAKERELIEKNAQFHRFFTSAGIIEDKSIQDPRKRKAKQLRAKRQYQNTQLLLENYQTIAWVVENFPEEIMEELEQPMTSVDQLLDRVDLELSMENRRLESRFRSVAKSRLLIDRVNQALTALRGSPGNGEELYQLIHKTYIKPEYADINDLFESLAMSRRKYYYQREKAIMLISIVLWSAPRKDVAQWLEFLTILDEVTPM